MGQQKAQDLVDWWNMGEAFALQWVCSQAGDENLE